MDYKTLLTPTSCPTCKMMAILMDKLTESIESQKEKIKEMETLIEELKKNK